MKKPIFPFIMIDLMALVLIGVSIFMFIKKGYNSVPYIVLLISIIAIIASTLIYFKKK